MADQKLTFEYSDVLQRTPDWYAIRRGKIGASSLWRWLSVSKAKATIGKPLKERLDYEKELMFERQFDTTFERYTNSAMQDGIDFEDFGRKQYEAITGTKLLEVGCYFNDYFVASPDRAIAIVGSNATDPDNWVAGIEIKILKDNSFLELLGAKAMLEANDQEGLEKTTTIHKHWKQVQGQLWATGWEYVDYVAVNFDTKKVIIVRITPDTEFHQYAELAVQETFVETEFDLAGVHDIVGEIPDGFTLALEAESAGSNKKGWDA